MSDLHPLRFHRHPVHSDAGGSAFPGERIGPRPSAAVSRRDFVRLAGLATIAAAGTACAGPTGSIVPYVTQPPELTPGLALHFATAMELDGYATGLVVTSREGRPIKVEGHPGHPASLGAAGVFAQASILELYDPDRGAQIREGAIARDWMACASAFSADELRRRCGADGAGLHVLVEPTASPTSLGRLADMQSRFPAAAAHVYAPLAPPHAADGARLAFGRALQPILDLSRADAIVSAGADLLGRGPFALRYARQFADGRRVRHGGDPMNRLYAIDGVPTVTAAAADHRVLARPDQVTSVLAGILRALRDQGADSGVTGADRLRVDAFDARCSAIAADLIGHRGRGVVVVGEQQPPVAHALGHAINAAIGAHGSTVSFVEPAMPAPQDGRDDLAALVEALRAGTVRVLVIIGGDPAYNTPVTADFASLVRRVPLSLYAGLHQTRTSQVASWYVPLAHYLESWGDARALDGTASIVQPLIAPLFAGRTRDELLGLLAGDARSPYDMVRATWQRADRLGADEAAWTGALRAGVIPGTAAPAVSAALSPGSISDAIARVPAPEPAPLHIAFTADASVHDGRFANNGWLQELPDPLTTLTWDNAALVSEATARAFGCSDGDVIEITTEGRTTQAPVLVSLDMADGLIALAFGYGQQAGGAVAQGVGSNAYGLWTERARVVQPATVGHATFLDFRFREPLAVAQLTRGQGDREEALHLTADDLRDGRNPAPTHRGTEPALYGRPSPGPRQWGMTIDLSVCTGCSACVVACQAENNVPVVGKTEMLVGRTMHWLRIDRFDLEWGRTGPAAMQPMLCQHCEDAPCEYVCPVNATVHSPDGLNEMVYNRCVGTRFCSNNCPYKVRRFNWLNHTAGEPEIETMARNPDVTVRDRGVMEKCTFCVQRIRRADIDAEESGSDAPYARLQTACQQACPTRAIVFGSVADPGSAVARDARADHAYEVLHELGTRPRIRYLARLRNPNPAWPREAR